MDLPFGLLGKFGAVRTQLIHGKTLALLPQLLPATLHGSHGYLEHLGCFGLRAATVVEEVHDLALLHRQL